VYIFVTALSKIAACRVADHATRGRSGGLGEMFPPASIARVDFYAPCLPRDETTWNGCNFGRFVIALTYELYTLTDVQKTYIIIKTLRINTKITFNKRTRSMGGGCMKL